MTRWTSALTMIAGLLLSATFVSAADKGSGTIYNKTVKGTPDIKSIQAINIGPEGLLLIGDGKGSQIIAVKTGDTKPVGEAGKFTKVESLKAKIAGRLGASAKDIDVLDMAFNPASGKAYLAVRRQSDKSEVILTVDPSGKIAPYQLKDIDYARIPLPEGEKAPVSEITDVLWAAERVIASGRANELFASKIFVIPGMITHDVKAGIYSAETYHVAHGKWETKAPMSVIMPYEEDGQFYLVGAFTCTPVVKYPIAALTPGAKVKGVSMVELGNGNRPQDMLSYQREGKPYVLTSNYRAERFYKRMPFGPSQYWSARIDRDLLKGNDKVNEKATWRIDREYKPLTDRITIAEEYHGVVQMDPLSDTQALVMREAKDGELDLLPLPLP